ncbi:uncharacterized protein K460DRAFT_436287 [Cucurbitaria berberidis CBS 394.84]|uniref:Uncharacterized protein n=1 Tax=Cucurbitaria berberidis CBS 394.84 TaxID=1168544 RepID=A0A9P4G8F6_9PLEO|nr:uncharacterized protein K460DRAFT_436287 [Cucurbitaria berberidis CBS 394.84]KAF1840822.1 hypothetical protein K460DRAFT_436287 [Cucurbitaria berberidis CBS 394.84]
MSYIKQHSVGLKPCTSAAPNLLEISYFHRKLCAIPRKGPHEDDTMLWPHQNFSSLGRSTHAIPEMCPRTQNRALGANQSTATPHLYRGALWKLWTSDTMANRSDSRACPATKSTGVTGGARLHSGGSDVRQTPELGHGRGNMVVSTRVYMEKADKSAYERLVLTDLCANWIPDTDYLKSTVPRQRYTDSYCLTDGSSKTCQLLFWWWTHIITTNSELQRRPYAPMTFLLQER